jgi:hypothetical protein
MGMMVAVLALGCDPVSWTPTNTPPKAPLKRDPAKVEVFMTSPPKRKYAEVGLLERSKGMLEINGTENAMRDLRESAAKHGCDAIMMQSSEANTYGGADKSGGIVSTSTVMRAVCLVYTE